LLCQCSRLAATATPQQQAAARVSADEVAAAVAAAQQHALHGAHAAAAAAQGQQQQQSGAALLAPGRPDPIVISADQALNLSSRPTAKHKLLLDFDGYVLEGSVWNTITKRDKIVSAGYDKDGDPSSFSAEELAGTADGHAVCLLQAKHPMFQIAANTCHKRNSEADMSHVLQAAM
jgi:hypothetical protein